MKRFTSAAASQSVSIMASPSSTISTNMGLKNLLAEPRRLTSESERVNAELEALVMENYKVFVENLTCSVHLQSEVSERAEERRSSDLEDSDPSLADRVFCMCYHLMCVVLLLLSLCCYYL